MPILHFCLTRSKFQFTHPRGVRSTRNAHKVGAQGFNSRTREGCDRALFDEVHRQWVSIHAPVRGAMRIWSKFITARSFNSRTREGCDVLLTQLIVIIHVSIHAPVRGAISSRKAPRRPTCFNSRTREGCDRKAIIGVGEELFQFTHP